MNAYELIMKVNQKMNTDPQFAAMFNNLLQDLNRNPGLQQQIMSIAQITDEKKRQKALNQLPDNVKKSVKLMLELLN